MDNAKISELLDWLESNKKKVALSRVIGEKVALHAVNGLHWGLCPYEEHGEDAGYLDEMFYVDDGKGIYGCLSCGRTGDAIDYLAETRGGIPQALEAVAELSGEAMPRIDVSEIKRENDRRDRLYSLMREAALHYHANLFTPQGEVALDYLRKRELSDAVIRNFALGFSVDYTSLIDCLKGKGYTVEEMKECGVADERNGRVYDPLYGRMIIPIINEYNRVVAFGGRIFEAKGFAKYKNTRESALFIKSRELYGLHNLRKLRRADKLSEVFVVEGYMDVIAMYQAGFRNVVASMGTSLTEEQCAILSEYTDNVYLAYDGDAAGQKATSRGVDLLYAQGLTPRVITLIEELDPDEIIKKYGAEKIYELMESARGFVEYKIDDKAKDYALTDAEGRGKYASDVIDMLVGYVGKTGGERYLPRIAGLCALPEEVLRERLYATEAQKISLRKRKSKAAAADGTAYTKAVTYILYSLFTGADCGGSVAAYLTEGGAAKVYDYLRLTGSGGDIGFLTELADNAAAQGVLQCASAVAKSDVAGLMRDSLTAVKREYCKNMRERLFTDFAAAANTEEKYETNSRITAVTSLIKTIK